MATKRRYKVPGYRDGGRVPVPESAESEQQPMAAQPSAADDAVMRAVEAQRQAEAFQHRRSQEPMSVEQYVDSLPGLTDHKRRFLKSNSDMLNSEQRDLMAQAYVEAMQAGMRDDTPELDRWLVDTVRSEMNSRRARLADAARSAVGTMMQPRQPERSVEQDAASLAAEAGTLMSAYNARESAPDVVSSQLPQAAPVPRTPRMPMTAPVSREVPMTSGQRLAPSSQVTLSPEERFIARHSFSDPNMTDEAKERLYASQKARLRDLRSQGKYPESGQG